MSRVALVTGAAGFIGAHLCGRLARGGWTVRAVDALRQDDRVDERARRVRALAELGIAVECADLAEDPLDELVDGAAAVLHLAGQPGVRGSYGPAFAGYLRDNVLATQRLAEAIWRRGVARLVLASTSSVYGEVGIPAREDRRTDPRSPYGVTKLAAEGVARCTADRAGFDLVVLRYFTVYGPGQRSDMAFHRFLRAAIEGTPVPLYGDGTQSRDVTYVGDVVELTARAAETGQGIYNVGGGTPCSVRQALRVIDEIVGRPVPLDERPPAPGDVRHTRADTRRARAQLGFAPSTTLRAGLAAQFVEMLEQIAATAPACSLADALGAR